MRLHRRLLQAFRRPSAACVVISPEDEASGEWSTCLSGRLWKTWLLPRERIARMFHSMEPTFVRKDAARLRRARAFLGAQNTLVDRNTTPNLPHSNLQYPSPQWWSIQATPPFDLDAQHCPELIFELCNINFALEFRTLDATLTGLHPAH
jgi:hypothetical protein